jgi:hypothetical protein
MFVFALFAPVSHEGVIFRLQHSSPASYSPFCWDSKSHSWVRGEIPMDRFMSLPGATPAELAAVGLKSTDLAQH